MRTMNDILHGDEHLQWCICNKCTDEVTCLDEIDYEDDRLEFEDQIDE